MSNAVRLLRLQLDNGEGIYCSGIAVAACEKLGDSVYAFDTKSGQHPMPYNDSRLREQPFFKQEKSIKIRHAFNSYYQYRAWFYSDIFLNYAKDIAKEEKRELQLVIIEVNIDSMSIGYTQCVYDFTKAKIVATFDPLVDKQTVDKLLFI